MSTHWDHSYDVVSVGSGGGGLVAALAARDAGGTALVLEKRDLLGGSTAMSGGVVWIPNNPLMQDEGVPDSDEAGMQYFEATVGDVGPASTVERRRAFITEGAAMTRFLTGLGVRLVRCPGYSDYYSDQPGGSAEGRSMEPPPYDGKQLGPWLAKVQPGMAAGIGLVVKTNELRDVQYFNRSLRSFLIAARVQARTTIAKVTGRRLLTNGTALVAQMVKAAADRDVELWTGAAFTEFVVEDGRVTGVEVVKDGARLLIEARRGVVVAAGGFAHNKALRERYSGDQKVTGEWSFANPGDTGDAIEAALRLGAATDLLDEAWWLPGPSPLLGVNTLNAARNRPGAIIVDASGSRFVNESNSYVEVGKAMFARDKTARAVPAWVVFDEGYRRRYAHRRSLNVGKIPAEWLAKGLVKKADTLEDLAGICGIDAAGLTAQVKRWNSYAEKGEDPDYGRGRSAYNDCLGDPGYRINPSVGPLTEGPYYAFELFPADVGTCGGLVGDEHGRVLREDGAPIPGLYATGNGTATVTGRHYLGAGASIAYSMVYGYISARHAMASGS
ncbi:3-oxosteroid 1-dehydrogenase [Actinocorallia herbida]|uniref:3-oxosteroid 1-dehydrogenase n=1 Tax=Actinocorallia herbida TaxID=58109 RepID=A0A3N1CWJ1_9ACTN|nr:FAD-binding protein [Actinocorallia herbida]ROO85651.1 3-oxosteroid 1-dehydrogenase [Actinocorallia herbida]